MPIWWWSDSPILHEFSQAKFTKFSEHKILGSVSRFITPHRLLNYYISVFLERISKAVGTISNHVYLFFYLLLLFCILVSWFQSKTTWGNHTQVQVVVYSYQSSNLEEVYSSDLKRSKPTPESMVKLIASYSEYSVERSMLQIEIEMVSCFLNYWKTVVYA